MQPRGSNPPSGPRLKAATPSFDPTYTSLPAGFTATVFAPVSPGAVPPCPRHVLAPVSWTQPPAARRPAEPRLSETIALLTPDATYTYSPSELTANPSGSQSPGAVPPRPAQ